jgi:DNA uptake protein ComE-like DNA-binding protein
MNKLILAGALAVVSAGTASAQEDVPKQDSMKPKPTMDSAHRATPAPSQGYTTTALDINTASKKDLEAAGLGPYADKIMAGRPFKSTKELVDKHIVPQDAWSGLKDKVKVGPS